MEWEFIAQHTEKINKTSRGKRHMTEIPQLLAKWHGALRNLRARAWQTGLVILCAALCAVMMVSCKENAAKDGVGIAAPDASRRLVIAISQYPSTLHPGIDSMLAKSYVHGFTRRPITVFDPSWERICMLCTALPTLENGLAKIETRKDGTRGIAATYAIPAEAVWGDGVPVTTKDIMFTWETGKDSAVGISNYELFSKDIVDITPLDEKRFTIHYDKVSCSFNELADFNVLPAHIEEPVYRAAPDQYRTANTYDTAPATPGLYNGPYVIAQAVTGVEIRLTRNPHWWGKAPYFDEILIKTIENTNALSAQLLAGQVDMISGELGLAMDQAAALEKRLERQGNTAFRFVYKPGLIYEHIDINQDSPVLSDVRVRRALLHAINRDAIVQQLFAGKQPVAHHNIHPLDVVYHDGIARYPFDPQRAVDLLKEAGWTRGVDGVIRNQAGEALSFTFRTTAGNKTRELVQQAIQSNWADIGVQAQIKNETPRVLFGETLQKRTFDGAVMYAWMSAPANVPKTTLHSDLIPSEANGWSGQNYVGFSNPRMDKDIDDLEVVCGESESAALWRDIQVLYAEELPALPLFFRADSFVLPQWLDGVVPTGHQFPTSLWSQDWKRAPDL